MTAAQTPTFILLPGHWLGAWAWDQVLAHLAAAGARALPLTLPGLDAQDPARASRTLEDQAAAIRDAIDSVDREVVLVAHSGANAPASLVLDQAPARVRRMIWVDSGPVAPGTVFAPELPESVHELPLPPFEVLGEEASLEGLTPADLERFRERAVPQPGHVLRGAVPLRTDPEGAAARRAVPTTLVCCSIPSAQLMDLAQAGHPMFAEVARLKDLDTVDLATGHWPMWSRPEDLARVILAALS